MKAGPAMMTNFRMAEQFGKKLTQLNSYVRLQQNMDAKRRQLEADAHKVLTK